MSFGENLLDGFEVLGKRTSQSIEGIKNVSGFFKNVADVLVDSGKSMAECCNKFKTKKISTFDFTVKTSMESVVRELESFSSIQGGLAEQLSAASKEIEAYCKDREKLRKKLLDDASKLIKEWENQQSTLRKAKDNYHKLAKEADSIQVQMKKKEAEPNVKSKVIQEMGQKHQQAAEKARAAEEKYTETLRETNDKQRKHYTVDQPALLQEFQTFEEDRINYCRTQIERLLSLLNALSLNTKWDGMLGAIRNAAETLDTVGDIDGWATLSKTSVSVPSDISFEAFVGEGGASSSSSAGSSASISTSGAGFKPAPSSSGRAKKQWGLLPGEDSELDEGEKKKKLGAQLAEIEKESSEMQKQIVAGEKLVQMFSKDPQGKKQAEEKLDEDRAALSDLNRARDLVNRQLAELGGGDAGEAAPAAAGDGTRCKALYVYKPENDTELELKEGDIVYVTEKDDSGWWYATKGDKQGFIPANYVVPADAQTSSPLNSFQRGFFVY